MRLFLPVAISIASYGVVWGVLAGQAGLTPLEVVLMSGLVYAGASQFVAIDMWSPLSLPVASIVVATAVINLRMLLMTATLRPQFEHLPRWRALLAMFLVSDEVWAMTMAEHAKGGGGAAFMLGAGTLAWIGWGGSSTTPPPMDSTSLSPRPSSRCCSACGRAAAISCRGWRAVPSPSACRCWCRGPGTSSPAAWAAACSAHSSSTGCAMPLDALLAILGMAAVTYAIRVGGFLIAERLPTTGFVALWMRNIPGAVLAALIAPDVLKGGPAAWLATAAATLVYLATRNVLATIAGGVLAMFLLRRFAGL